MTNESIRKVHMKNKCNSICIGKKITIDRVKIDREKKSYEYTSKKNNNLIVRLKGKYGSKF